MCTLLCLTIIEFHEICNFCCYTKISCNQNFEDSICASIMLDRLLQEWKLNITFSSSLLGVVICTWNSTTNFSVLYFPLFTSLTNLEKNILGDFCWNSRVIRDWIQENWPKIPIQWCLSMVYRPCRSHFVGLWLHQIGHRSWSWSAFGSTQG